LIGSLFLLFIRNTLIIDASHVNLSRCDLIFQEVNVTVGLNKLFLGTLKIACEQFEGVVMRVLNHDVCA
jgi:hypothetical protein